MNRSATAASGKCERCGGTLTVRTLREFRDDRLIGIAGVVIMDAVEEWRCENCGHLASIGFVDLEGLIAAVAVARVAAPAKLDAADVRFLRKALGWSSKDLAAKLEVRDETVSRWENNREPIGPTSEKLLRLIVAEFLAEKAPAVEVDEKGIASMRIRGARAAKPVEMRFRPVRLKIARRTERAWKPVEAA